MTSTTKFQARTFATAALAITVLLGACSAGAEIAEVAAVEPAADNVAETTEPTQEAAVDAAGPVVETETSAAETETSVEEAETPAAEPEAPEAPQTPIVVFSTRMETLGAFIGEPYSTDAATSTGFWPETLPAIDGAITGVHVEWNVDLRNDNVILQRRIGLNSQPSFAELVALGEATTNDTSIPWKMASSSERDNRWSVFLTAEDDRDLDAMNLQTNSEYDKEAPFTYQLQGDQPALLEPVWQGTFPFADGGTIRSWSEGIGLVEGKTTGITPEGGYVLMEVDYGVDGYGIANDFLTVAMVEAAGFEVTRENVFDGSDNRNMRIAVGDWEGIVELRGNGFLGDDDERYETWSITWELHRPIEAGPALPDLP